MNVWDWNSPIALAIFFVGLALSFALFSWAIKNLTEVDLLQRQRRR